MSCHNKVEKFHYCLESKIIGLLSKVVGFVQIRAMGSLHLNAI